MDAAFSATPTDLSFQLQPFTANNAIYRGGTITISTPAAYTRIALIVSTGSASTNPNISVTFNFASGAPEVFSNIAGGISGDWFGGSPTAYTADGRVATADSSFNNVNAGNPRLCQTVFTLNNTANLTFVVIANGTTANNAIMAISGEAIPEPSALALLGLSALCSTVRRRR